MTGPSTPEYLLGVDEAELERLHFQHEVWRPVTDAFLDRIGVRAGWKCLDAGAGPGLVTFDLRERVGDEGEVTALEPSKLYLEWLRKETRRRGYSNIRVLEGTAENSSLDPGQYDLVFSRWVIAFVQDAERFLQPLFNALRPGGVIAIQDYMYEGLALFPRGGAFDRIHAAVLAYYRSVGGDPYVTASLPGLFHRHGIQTLECSPHSLAGGTDSGVMQWAHRFFTVHIPRMVERGILGETEGAAMIADWTAHARNPDALFFSPIVVDVAGRKTNHP
jgi:SAM-dependent methyltransferase